MTNKRKVTMKDVALRANVTTQTVSRALNGSPNILPETKKKVLDIANELNYVKNTNASILRGGESKIIAVFYDNLRNLYFSIASDLLEEQLRKHGYNIMTIPVFNDKLTVEMYNYALSLNVDGIITFLEVDESLSKRVKDNPFPIILYGRKSKYKNIGYIGIDDVKGGVLAGEELLSLGGKNFLYVSESMQLDIAKDRYLGYKKALGNNPLNVIDVTQTSIEDGLNSLFNNSNEPDSIFCFNDMLAFGVIRYYEKKHLSKPNIIGFDALSNQILLPCELESIGVDEKEMAIIGVTHLLDLIKNKSNDEISVIMPVKLYK